MKRALFLMIGCLVGLVMIANPITKEEAQQKAVQFLSKKQSNRALAPRLKPVSLQEVSGLSSDRLYAFNVGQKNGFVVMSADDCTGELILGYADKGELSMETMPDNMREWLKGYDDEIKWMQEHGVTNQVAASRANSPSAARTPISPLLTSRWSQDEPYNNYCPIYSEEKCVTGCVATATAQVLYYYGKKRGVPTTTSKAIPGYTTAAYSLAVGEKAVRTFDWLKMNDTYPSTDEANEEVARLMEYVGAGLKMDYRPGSVGGSSAYHVNIPYVLTEYFGYDKSACRVNRNDYSYGDWISMMYEMLSDGNPVLYDGHSTGGGHTFVLDGYAEEDYFHVNWGWGGDSDGHFKLSVLYSDKQGIGGSTSQDGYSSSQGAIIHVNPVSSGVDTSVRMTVENAYPVANHYERNSSSEDFADVGFAFSICNYTGAEATFDFGWGLYRGEELLSTIYLNSVQLGNLYSYDSDTYKFSFGADLSDGEYLLKPISRKHGTDTWYLDFGSEFYYITATISGNTLTLARSVLTDIRATESTISDNPRVGTPVTITATIHNCGTFYSGDISVGALTGGSVSSNPSYQILASQQIEVDAGQDIDVTFTFTPSTTGNMELYLLDKDRKAISSKIDITVSSSNATTGTLAIDGENDITLDNAYSPDCKQWYYGFYGSKILGHVKVTNNSTTDAHTSGLLIRLWKYNGENYSSWDSHTYATAIAANGGTQTIDFVFDELEVGTRYLVTYHYTNGAELLNDSEEPQVTHYSMKAYYGVTTIAADGTETTVAPTASVTVPDNALVLDISQLTTVTSVTPNSNPNTLYIVGTSAPSGLDGKNVIQNGTAETLTLQDGYGFYTPIVFTAANVSYTRTFTTGADGTNGWSTIVLPFDVKQVKQGDKVIDWFHDSSDTGKHFWVKNFSSEDGSTVYFDFVDQMKADTPYIIAVPGDTWGDKWDLTNKAITFYGEDDTTFEPGTLSSVSGYHYKFAGTKQVKSVTDCYVMNNEGNAFNKTTTTVQPFRAYFSPLTMMSGQTATASLHIGSEGNNPTGITEMTYDRRETKGAAYNLNGQRVAHPRKGLYIVDGKKVIMK